METEPEPVQAALPPLTVELAVLGALLAEMPARKRRRIIERLESDATIAMVRRLRGPKVAPAALLALQEAAHWAGAVEIAARAMGKL